MERTEKQWNNLGYKVIPGATGELRWNNRYCTFKTYYFNESQVLKMSNEEFKAYKKEKNHQAYIKSKERKIKEQKLYELDNNFKTCYQWLESGYIVKSNQLPVRGQYLINHYDLNKGSDYYYYKLDQVEYNPSKAKEIMNNVVCPNNYDGRKYY